MIYTMVINLFISTLLRLFEHKKAMTYRINERSVQILTSLREQDDRLYHGGPTLLLTYHDLP